MYFLSEENIFLFLIQLFLLLGFSRGLGEFLKRWQFPPLTAEILVGIFFGPTVLGRLFPALQHKIFPLDPHQLNMLQTVAWLGIFFLMLESGLEIDFSSALAQKRDALKIALMGVVVPVLLVFAACLFLPKEYFVDPEQRIIFCLFMATVMSITALASVTRILHDLSLTKTDLGLLILSAVSINDILGWLIFTCILVFFTTGTLAFAKTTFLFLLTLLFVGFCLTAGRKLTDKIVLRFRRGQMPEPSTSLTFICLLGAFCGIVLQWIGVHALLGFLIAGIMAGSSKSLPERTRQVIAQMVFAIFIPLFFSSIGLHIDFVEHFDSRLVFFVCVLSILGKFLGAWLGARAAHISSEDRLAVAIAHTPGGMMEIVVGMVALEQHLITQKVFVAIVVSAIFSAVLVGPWLSFIINRRKKVSILEFFSQRAICADLKSSSRNEAISYLCEMASLRMDMPAVEQLKKFVLEREEVMGTAIEEGVALPHARLLGLPKPVVIFGRSQAGIDWNSPDGQLTHFIFLIFIPLDQSNIQVQILRAIAQVIGRKNIREAVLSAQGEEEIWEEFKKAFTIHHVIK